MEYTLKFLETPINRKVFDRWSNTFLVYLITNAVNNKKYVGITRHIKIRIHEHIRYSKNNYKVSMYLHKAIKKYGLESFNIRILKTAKNYDKLNIYEKKFITQFKSNNSNLGYNLTSGGNAGIPNDITITKKINSSQKIKVGQYDLSGKLINIYNSIMEASRSLNIPDNDIHRCCKKKWSRKGFMFYKSNINIPKKIDPMVSKRGHNFKGKSLIPHNAVSGYLLNVLNGEKFHGKSIVEIAKISGLSKDTLFRIRKNSHKKYKFFDK